MPRKSKPRSARALPRPSDFGLSAVPESDAFAKMRHQFRQTRSTIRVAVRTEFRSYGTNKRKSVAHRAGKTTFTRRIRSADKTILQRIRYIEVEGDALSDEQTLHDKIIREIERQQKRFKGKSGKGYRDFAATYQLFAGALIDPFAAKFRIDAKASRVVRMQKYSLNSKQRRTKGLTALENNRLTEMARMFGMILINGMTNVRKARARRARKDKRKKPSTREIKREASEET